MPATALPLTYLYPVVAKHKIELAMQGHRHSHIGEEIPQA